MAVQLRKQATQCGSQMHSLCRRLLGFPMEPPKPTNVLSYQRFIDVL